MKKAALITAVVLSAAMSLSACASSSSNNDSSSGPAITIGSANFAESQIVATIYSQALQDAKIKVVEKFNIGSREVTMAALKDGSIDLIPEYAGSLLQYLDPKTSARRIEDELTELKTKLPEGTVVLDASDAKDGDVLAVTKSTADKYKLTKVSDLASVADQLVLGAAPEWKTRQNGVLGLRDVYGINFKGFLTTDVDGPLTVAALNSDQVQVADLFSTDPAVKANKYVVLDDDKALFASENVLPLGKSAKLTDKVTSILNGISAKLTTESLIDMNERAAKGESLLKIAKDWLQQEGIVK